jgi:hypothetical protein
VDAAVALVARPPDDPAHRCIVTKPVGIVDVFVSGDAAKHRLPKLSLQGMAAVLAGADIGEHLSRERGQAKGIVKFAKGQQSGIRSHAWTMELQLQPAVKTQPQIGRLTFTRCCFHKSPPQITSSH